MTNQVNKNFYYSNIAEAIRAYGKTGNKNVLYLGLSDEDERWFNDTDIVSVWRGKKGNRLVCSHLSDDEMALILANEDDVELV